MEVHNICDHNDANNKTIQIYNQRVYFIVLCKKSKSRCMPSKWFSVQLGSNLNIMCATKRKDDKFETQAECKGS